MTTKQFNCSQADLVVVLGVALGSFEDFSTDFVLFSQMYEGDWLMDTREELTLAAAMPDEDALRSISEEIRRGLINARRAGCGAWQTLKRYISRSFEADLVPLKLKAAGGNYYKEAVNDGWPQALQMLTNGQNFIVANAANMAAVMPATFPDTYGTKLTAYKKELNKYEQSKEAITEGTQKRLKALNQIHRKVMDMMLDGQEIFREDDVVRKQFVFTEVLGRVSGSGLAGVRGNIKDAISNMNIANAIVSVTNSDGQSIGTATTDAEGNFLINTPSGEYNVGVVASNYNSRTIAGFTVDVGTVSRLDISLSPIETEEPS